MKTNLVFIAIIILLIKIGYNKYCINDPSTIDTSEQSQLIGTYLLPIHFIERNWHSHKLTRILFEMIAKEHFG
jgi:hypothetical protein